MTISQAHQATYPAKFARRAMSSPSGMTTPVAMSAAAAVAGARDRVASLLLAGWPRRNGWVSSARPPTT